MSSTGWAATIVVILAIAGGAWWYTAKAPTAPVLDPNSIEAGGTGTNTDQGMPDTGVTGTVSLTTYAMANVAIHKDAASCWTVIDNFVYDLTAWISQHPGGERAILSICGKDGTAAFRGQHDNAKKQADILATFKIGALAQ